MNNTSHTQSAQSQPKYKNTHKINSIPEIRKTISIAINYKPNLLLRIPEFPITTFFLPRSTRNTPSNSLEKFHFSIYDTGTNKGQSTV